MCATSLGKWNTAINNKHKVNKVNEPPTENRLEDRILELLAFVRQKAKAGNEDLKKCGLRECALQSFFDEVRRIPAFILTAKPTPFYKCCWKATDMNFKVTLDDFDSSVSKR